MKDFNQPELTGPSGIPVFVPEDLAANFRSNALDQGEVNRGLVDDLSERLRARIREELGKSAGLENERGVVLSMDGGIISRSLGGKISVSAKTDDLQDSVFFRNHPDGKPLSLEDLEALFVTGVDLVMASGGDDLYAAKTGELGKDPDIHAHLRLRYSYMNDVGYAVISDLVKRGELEMDVAEKAHIHAVLCQLAKERIISYSRISYGT